MKKFLAFMMSAVIGASLLTGCSVKPGGSGEEEPMDKKLTKDKATISFVMDGLYPDGEVKDAASGFSSASDVKSAGVFVNGEYKTSFTELGTRQDIKLELYSGSKVRLVQVSAGTAFTLPAKDVTADYSISKYRTQYTFDDSVLTYSAEYSNPYTGQKDGWYIYVNEWLLRHLLHPDYYENQGLTRLNELDFEVTPVGSNGTSDGSRWYPTAKNGNLTRREGYEIYRFDVLIADGEKVERPYYNIGVVHEVNDAKNFGLFVMKSKTNKAEVMDELVMSWTKFTAKGIQRNYFEGGKPLENPRWNEATKAYFNQLMTEDKKNWGVFSYSMPGEEWALHPGQSGYDDFYNKSVAMQQYIENDVWGKKYDIYMTYTHLGWGPVGSKTFTPHYFPSEMAKALAGGNGDGTRPTLEFTFQFTTNNNLVDEEKTPMFDILRGKYDEYFKRLALDIKNYGAPLMLRLNNEMNTDWTSYSGIMNLLDPDIFNLTWQRMYDIFEENGVDNVIWIWNPIAVSCPYSGWSEDLCYFPGKEYVQLLGGTSYEMNNYATNEEAERNITSFAKHYGNLYNKNKDYFADWGMIIGEFACGSGGDAGDSAGKTLGRNALAQAKWVEGMLNELYSDNPAAYAKQIKGLIWFNCNDEVEDGITNRLRFAAPDGSYDDLAATHLAFRNGFQKANKK